jgi:hypothetical protein
MGMGKEAVISNRKQIKSYCISLVLVVSVLAPGILFAEELEMINRPVNVHGMSGLLFTTIPFTLSDGAFEVALGALSENSTKPNYTRTEIPTVNITAGIGQNKELAVKTSYFRKTDNDTNQKERATGNTELSYKWNFLPQNESSQLPALAAIITGIAPSGEQKDAAEPGRVTHWGARLGLSAGREILWGDHVIGIYGDLQMVVHDLSDENIRDRYALANAGLLFPISKYRNLQILLEYTKLSDIDRETTEGGDYSAITYGLRLVSEGFNLSIGTQFIHKQIEGFDDSSRIVGMMSLKL